MGESGVAQEHVLFFHDVMDAPHVERHPSLAAAVQRVEQLANDEGVTDCELYALDPVRLQRQQRWHVAVAGAVADAGVPAPRSAVPTMPPPATAPTAAPTAAPTPPPPAAPPVRPAPPAVDHADALDVEVVDEVFHEVVREVAAETVDPAESADVLPSAPRGRGLGFFVHQ